MAMLGEPAAERGYSRI